LSVSVWCDSYCWQESSNFGEVKAKLPFRLLIVTNFVMAGVIAIFLFIFLFLYHFDQPVVLHSFTTFMEFVFVGFINIVILAFIYRLGVDGHSFTKRMMWYASGYICASIFFLTPWTSIGHLTKPHNGLLYFLETVTRGFCVNSIIIFVQTFFLLQYEKSRAIIENSRLKVANIEAANLLLKQQIQPHFLFNALSVLKTLYKKDISSGEAYLVNLAHFLRVSVSYSNKNVTGVADEINFCRAYIEMQHLRFGSAMICDIDIPEGVMLRGSVPTFSIQSLIENAIKHNDATAETPLTIKIFLKEERIIVSNNLNPKLSDDKPSGKGFTNLIERYRILSGDEVTIHSDDLTFSVSIKVLTR
jgi:two-component system LytT family sensor kinase